MDHNVNHKQTHADKDQQTVKSQIYKNIVAFTTISNQQAYCKVINKDINKEKEKTFSQRQKSPNFYFLHYLKSMGIK